MVNTINKDEDEKESRSIPALLAHKLSGGQLTCEEIQRVINAITDKSMEDAQLGALLAAIYIRGMSPGETATLTKCMRDSGRIFQWPSDWKVVDKHSTGGVGDKVSLILAPALAAIGLKVPMISGRGLGHTGGTLDKLESIPGYRVALNGEEMLNVLKTVGCCIVGQTESLVPADKRMYSIRDITSTVASVPLIVSSIISKKACENLQSLVLDVKYGCGALYECINEADILAKALVDAGNSLGIHTSALVTSMAVPLGRAVGNTLEVDETVQCLRGQGPADLEELVVELGGELLRSSGLSTSTEEGGALIKKTLYDGKAMAKFRDMLLHQGVSPKVVEDICENDSLAESLPRSKDVTKVFANKSGTIVEMNAMDVAHVCLHLGAGRVKASDKINHGAGMLLLKIVGDTIKEGEPWAEIHHDLPLEKQLYKRAQNAVVIDQNNPNFVKPPLVAKHIH